MRQQGPASANPEHPERQERPESKEYQAAARQRRLAALHALAEQAMAANPNIPPPGATTRRTSARSAQPTRAGSARRRWLPLAGGVALALFLIVAVVAAVPSLRARAFGGIGGIGTTPVVTKPAAPDASTLYFDADVPWTTVQVDSKTVQPSLPGTGTPLHLRPGRHIISWEADPFPAKRCILTVPAATSDSCIAAFEGVAHVPGEPPAQILRLEEESSDLLANHLNPLYAAVQSALDSYSNQITPIEAGEPAYINGAPNNGSGGISDGTYSASFTFALDTQSVGSEACQLDLGTGNQNCNVMSAQCLPICSLDYAERQSLGAALPANEWVALAASFIWRNYFSSSGEPAYPQQTAFSGLVSFSDHTLLVGIRWQNGSWQAQPLIGSHLIASFIQDTQQRILVDPACAGAAAYFVQNVESDGYSQVRFVSNDNVTAGCLVQAISASSGQQVEYLERLGVLLAVNGAAHQLHGDLPVASGYAQQLAASLAANKTVPMQTLTRQPVSSSGQ